MPAYVKDGHELGAEEGSQLAVELEKNGWESKSDPKKAPAKKQEPKKAS